MVGEPPPLQPSDECEIEGLLRAFMRSQLPQSWPPPQVYDRLYDRRAASPPDNAGPPDNVGPPLYRSTRGRNVMRSRRTLAAAVALLLVGSWLLPSRFTSSHVQPHHGLNGPMISNTPSDAPKKHKTPNPPDNNKPGLAADEDEHAPDLPESDLPRLP
jgi:hypothetical protein